MTRNSESHRGRTTRTQSSDNEKEDESSSRVDMIRFQALLDEGNTEIAEVKRRVYVWGGDWVESPEMGAGEIGARESRPEIRDLLRVFWNL